ncbi:MAG: c-type cytochrome [Deltaproteobacteria bacterium]|nr:c-type cytochrome [Deltaproteobacteria bacterium]
MTIRLLMPALVFFALGAGIPAYAATAEENYRFHCAQCHGLEGKGNGINATREMPVSPRDHTSALEMGKLTDADIINAITDGGRRQASRASCRRTENTFKNEIPRIEGLSEEALQLQGR